MCDELAHESFVIFEGDDAFILVARDWLLELHAFFYQPLDPESERAGANRKRRYGDLPAALSATTRVRPWEECENRSRAARLVPEVEMVRSGVVEIDRALDETKAEDASVEIQIPLGIAGDSGDVMNAGGLETHRAAIPERSSRVRTRICLASFLRLALIRAGTRLAVLATVAALMLIRMRRDIFGIGATGSGPGADLAVVGGGLFSLFLLFSGCHNISTSFHETEATDMPFAEAMM